MLRDRWRYLTVQLVLIGLLSATVWRVVHLQVLQKEFLISEGTSRWNRVEVIHAPRGMLTDRFGEPMAVSTPVTSIWADPRELDVADIAQLAQAADVSERTLNNRALQHKAFMYVRRHMNPDEAEQVLALGIPGVYGQQEYKRYYPAGEVSSHVVGFTDIDDRGQEGVELGFEAQLAGHSGKKQVIRDLIGRSVRDVEGLLPAEAGDNLSLTIDMRLQYLAYRELKKAILESGSSSGSVVMMDVHTGDILAMVNQPSYNPNDRSTMKPEALRNRAITDALEPGSVMKPLTMAIALEQGAIRANADINTSPGRYRLGQFTIRDFRNYGVLSATEIIQKSSNVGIVKVAENLDKVDYWQLLYDFGLGEAVGLGFPGEASGRLPSPMRWDSVIHGALAYGYGLAVTPVHLAQAYATLANDGQRVYANLVQGAGTGAVGEQVIRPETAATVLKMMESVVEPGGTATRARLDWYSVAGKTGTTHQVGSAGYEDEKYVSSFVGIAPANAPEIVTVIVVNDPPEDAYYGGEIAAPVFRGIMQQAMPILNIQPDQTPLLAERSP